MEDLVTLSSLEFNTHVTRKVACSRAEEMRGKGGLVSYEDVCCGHITLGGQSDLPAWIRPSLFTIPLHYFGVDLIYKTSA